MTPADLKDIQKRVKEDRKKVLPPFADPLPLKFTNGRFPTDAEALSEADQRQLVAVGVDGVGEAWPPARLLEEGPDEGFSDAEVWDVLDATGALAYRVYIYGTDNGTVARGDTLEIVAGMSQGGIELARKKAKGTTDQLITELVRAAAAVPKAEQPKGSCLRFFRD